MRSSSYPAWEIKVLRTVNFHRIAIELVNHQNVISICCELVGHQLTILPDTDHVREEENGFIGVNGFSSSLGNVNFCLAEFGGFSGWLTSVLCY